MKPKFKKDEKVFKHMYGGYFEHFQWKGIGSRTVKDILIDKDVVKYVLSDFDSEIVAKESEIEPYSKSIENIFYRVQSLQKFQKEQEAQNKVFAEKIKCLESKLNYSKIMAYIVGGCALSSLIINLLK